MYVFKSVVGNIIVDKNSKIYEESKKKHKNLKQLPKKQYKKVLSYLKDSKYYGEFYKKNLALTKKAIKESVNEDNLIIQAISNIDELERIGNTFSKRLREWFGLYCPELSGHVSNHENFIDLISLKSRAQLMKEFKIKDTMGSDLAKIHIDEIMHVAKRAKEIYSLEKQHEQYLEKIMKKYCPNLLELAGVTIGARLLQLGKSLKRLAMLPASTIQLLGAEKALFRHLKTGSRSPKYGVIFAHQIIQRAPKELKGKASRMLADKLSLCCRLDYFKGEFKAKQYRKEIEEKLK